MNNHKKLARQHLAQEIYLIPYSKLATNLFHCENSMYQLVVDCYSHFPLIYNVDQITVKHIISHMLAIFFEHGWSDTLVANIGLFFTGSEFKQAMKEMRVHHTCSSPHYHQSNGFALKECLAKENTSHMLTLPNDLQTDFA